MSAANISGQHIALKSAYIHSILICKILRSNLLRYDTQTAS